MHRDTKVGLALGVLLVGVVGAFFFRNEGQAVVDVPELADPAAVDASIADRDVIPYLGNGTPGDVPNTAADDPHWRLPDFLQEESPADDPRSPFGREPLPGGPVTSRDRPANSLAEDEAVVTDANGTRYYVVQSGDTLTGIASRVLGSYARHQELFEANRDVLESPDRLRLGQRLRIPGGGGLPAAVAGGNRVAVDADSSRAPRVIEARPAASSTRKPEVGERLEGDADEAADPVGEPETIAIEEVTTPAETPTSPRSRFVPVRRSPYTGSVD